ncbi:ISAs1 family transposase [Candidatus Kaiserbacteria bacterium]|nr:ISAs1 family transposase [Candidatus Kaiserbacteria bacterium]
MSQHSFFTHFHHLHDPRVERTKRHSLMDILFIAVCAMLGGANDFVGMEKFGKSKIGWLQKFIKLPNGIPSHDTFGRVFQALEPQEFAASFQSWVRGFEDIVQGAFINIDGKTARAAHDKANDLQALHVVSAWASDHGLVLGQVAVDDKSNEITAIPKLLQILELHGALVTIDAMGCQSDIAATLHERGADYILAVKGNQEHLEEDVVAAFAAADEQREAGQSKGLPTVFENSSAGHGRQEQRRCEALPVPKTLRNPAKWPGLRSICRVTRTYTEKGVEKSEVRYFISTLPPQAQRLGMAIRGHWGVENGLHWVLDMVFDEDRSRARLNHAQENLALVRRWVLSVLRQDKTIPGGIQKKRLQAGWNERNMENLLNLF